MRGAAQTGQKFPTASRDTSIPPTVCRGEGCSQGSHVNSGIHLSPFFTRYRQSDLGGPAVKPTFSSALSLVVRVHRPL